MLRLQNITFVCHVVRRKNDRYHQKIRVYPSTKDISDGVYLPSIKSLQILEGIFLHVCIWTVVFQLMNQDVFEACFVFSL